jgi:hypothetical protein
MLASNGQDAEAAAWAAGGLSAWLHGDGRVSLQRCLGLPTRARNVQIGLRNRWLLEAASFVTASTEWAKAAALHAEIEAFESRRWPCWRRDNLPPGLHHGRNTANLTSGTLAWD